MFANPRFCRRRCQPVELSLRSVAGDGLNLILAVPIGLYFGGRACLPPRLRRGFEGCVIKYVYQTPASHGVAALWNLPIRPERGDTTWTTGRRHVTVDRGVSGRTVLQQWPQVKHDLDQGVP